METAICLLGGTMDTLCESLEELLDAEGNPDYEVGYSVRGDPRRCHGHLGLCHPAPRYMMNHRFVYGRIQ